MKLLRTTAALAVTGLLAPLQGLNASPAGEPRVVLAVDGTSETRNLPVIVAERLGYFRDEGLAVTLVDAPAEPSPAELMKDGRADGAVAFYHHTFMSQVDDHLVTRSVIAMGISPGLSVIVADRLRGEVKKLADLKGRRIFTGGANSGKTTTANWIALHAGFGIHDYTALPLMGRDEMAAALRDGTADAVVAHQPDADFYVARGNVMLADVTSAAGTRAALGTLFPSTALYLPKSFIAAHPGTVQHLVNACRRALTFIARHDATSIAAILPPKMAGKDRAAFVHLLEEDKQMFETDGVMPEAAARAEWQAMTALAPKYAGVAFDETFTNMFVSHDR
ncbi:ABC transporter substrate-binding protein [Sphingomonas sp. AR_OL41]|nr:ABC transporter substrate-binding protein [Sphingomonas sp. AR_OL41]MDH7974450.1 ABC transporter substrate-binding protein [Sphingomonas sp. AR_OL41]